MYVATKNYISDVFDARYFWAHLALADLRSKYRRSYMGVLWAMLQPMAFTLLLSFVMGRIFKAAVVDYIPYVFSGLIVWEFITASIVSGSNSFITAEIYIKQYIHRLAIYPLRHVLSSLITLMIASLGLLTWIFFWKPENLMFVPIVVLSSIPLLFFLVWPVAIISAFLGTIFRDFQQLIIIILQALWYISPVFFQTKMFYDANISFLVDKNPVYHLLSLFRMPLLEGQFPSFTNYFFVIGTILLLWLFAGLIISKKESKLIFYL